ncbi:HepT-like ribonuclease domain-containing protein [Agrobacterium sp. BA1120]|uniref:HepT-like ribonuclease domain-containing protein n=1 Tax=Agrobacterium sp. BA1120 TaxID=3228927 RepID=UPI00336AD733
MAKRRIDLVLVEMLDAIDGIETHTAGKTIEDFERDWLLKLAIQRALEIISEASRHIPDDLLNAAPDVPWKQIRGVGNVLRHEYHKVADDVVWVVVTEHIAPLKKAVESILKTVEDPRF